MSLRDDLKEARRLAFDYGVGRLFTVRGQPINGFVSVSPMGDDRYGTEEQYKAVVVVRVILDEALALPAGAFSEGDVFSDDGGRKYRVTSVVVPASGIMLEVHCVTV